MYSLAGFGKMIDDQVRVAAYTEALRRSVTSESVVLDIGAGTGILSLLACRFGARHVYALEPSHVSALIERAARDNGFSSRITVMSRKSSEVTLPERAHVIVSDLHGVLPVFHTALADLADARERLLAPGGRLIPSRETLHVAIVSAEAAFDARRRPWLSRPEDLDLSSALEVVSNGWLKYRAEPQDLLCQPRQLAVLDYNALTDPRVRYEETFRIDKRGTAHGLLVWFESELVPEVGFSNAPGADEAIYAQAFFTWPRAVDLAVGDEVRLAMRADPVGDDYQWTWTTELRGSALRAPVRFRQSELLGAPLPLDALRKRSADFTPALTQDAELTLRALERMRSGTTLAKLAEELHEGAPDRFSDVDRALDFVADLSARFSR